MPRPEKDHQVILDNLSHWYSFWKLLTWNFKKKKMFYHLRKNTMIPYYKHMEWWPIVPAIIYQCGLPFCLRCRNCDARFPVIQLRYFRESLSERETLRQMWRLCRGGRSSMLKKIKTMTFLIKKDSFLQNAKFFSVSWIDEINNMI